MRMISKEISPFVSEIFDGSKISHGFFGRAGGVSQGIYEGLNCGFSSNDLPKNVKLNRLKVSDALGLASTSLINPYQIHSNICGFIEKPFRKDGPRMDAFVTRTKGLGIAILTADCTPILFADEENGVVGAAHAGWQGALSGIIENTIDCMVRNGANLEFIKAAIGPCIAQKSYEVSQDFYDRFIESDIENKLFFETGLVKGKFQFDLKKYCAKRLSNKGVAEIEILPHDTCSQKDDFFSNRRRNQLNETDYGRNISVIAIN